MSHKKKPAEAMTWAGSIAFPTSGRTDGNSGSRSVDADPAPCQTFAAPNMAARLTFVNEAMGIPQLSVPGPETVVRVGVMPAPDSRRGSEEKGTEVHIQRN